MPPMEPIQIENATKMSKIIQYVKFILPILGLVIALAIVILALSIATLVKVNKTIHEPPNDDRTSTSTTQPSQHSSQPLDLVSSIRIDEVMTYLNKLQRIATQHNGTRAINTPGFNATLDYITNYLTANTNYKINTNYFFVRNFELVNDPILMSSIDGTTKNYNYSKDPSAADIFHAKYSTSANLTNFTELTSIPNVGCTDEDWQKANPPPEGRVVLVKRGICLFREKAELAAKYKPLGLLFYNDGTSPDRVQPIEISLGQTNSLPALFLSFPIGQALAQAAEDTSKRASVKLTINTKDLPDFPVGNICADTPSGNITETIVIGSHSDGVPAGPGINDNGSGTAANLALAVALARLFRTSTYPKYNYRVRFCWWGAEEVGLLGSDYHVTMAKNSTVVGERLSDYLINLNYDMLGSPNYMFGIYDGRTAKNDTPTQALPGSNKITALFKDWFVKQNLPWDYTDFSGRSDYGPFLAEGIVAGGLFSGADGVKTKEERDRYDEILGQGMGGIPGIIHDPCYHQACDSIQNINVFGYEKMVQAAAFALEYLGRQENLKEWLYPSSEIQRVNARSHGKSFKEYNSVNEYFGLPYL